MRKSTTGSASAGESNSALPPCPGPSIAIKSHQRRQNGSPSPKSRSGYPSWAVKAWTTRGDRAPAARLCGRCTSSNEIHHAARGESGVRPLNRLRGKRRCIGLASYEERVKHFSVALADRTIEVAAMPVDFVCKAQTPVPIDRRVGRIRIDKHASASPSIRICQYGQ